MSIRYTTWLLLLLLCWHATLRIQSAKQQQPRPISVLHHHVHPGTDSITTTPPTTSPATDPPTSTATPTPYTPSPPTAYPSSTPTPAPTTSAPTTTGPTGYPGNPVTYHNGLMLFPIPSLYILFYGNWTLHSPGSIDLIDEWASNINGSSLLNILSTYYYVSSGSVIYGTNQTRYLGYVHNQTYPYGTSLGNGEPFQMVKDLILAGTWTWSINHVYLFVFTNDVSYSVLCSGFCGVHGFINDATIGGAVNMGFIASCGSGCSVPSAPNGNQQGENVLNIMWHEFIEAISDPRGNGGWYDSSNEEIADICQHNYGTTYASAFNGQQANIHIGTKDYILQTLWLNVGVGQCAISY